MTDVTVVDLGDGFAHVHEQILDLLQEALQQGGLPKTDVKLVQAQSQSFSVEDVAQWAIYVGAGAGTWFSKKWADTYVWPLIQKRIEQNQHLRDLEAWYKDDFLKKIGDRKKDKQE